MDNMRRGPSSGSREEKRGLLALSKQRYEPPEPVTAPSVTAQQRLFSDQMEDKRQGLFIWCPTVPSNHQIKANRSGQTLTKDP
jgi:hypothetical protein